MNLPANAGDTGSIPGLGRSPGKGVATHSTILMWKSHGQRSLAAIAHGGHKTVGHDLAAKQQQ